jgi:chemotaxis protein CheD
VSSCATDVVRDITVGMGQAVYASAPARLTTLLGSCIAIALYSSAARAGMLAHVVLPHANGLPSNPSKFADSAVPHMLVEFHKHGLMANVLVANIVGGACMFGDGSYVTVGDDNVKASVEALGRAGIRIAGRHVGGTVGRRICFDLATGRIVVESAGRCLDTI